MPTFYRPKGCDRCENKGFTGRRGIYELLVMEDVVAGNILAKADAQTIKRAAMSQGMEDQSADGMNIQEFSVVPGGVRVTMTGENVNFAEMQNAQGQYGAAA